jgi:hypothetical protein
MTNNEENHLGIPKRLLHQRWRDMSDWVVHFTSSEDNLRSILSECFIRPSGPYGNGKNIREVKDRHLSACFSEIPLDHLERLYQRRGRWGIGFHKRIVDAAGGGRVWYQERGSILQETIFDMYGGLLKEQNFAHPLWSLSPFIDVMSDDYNYRFDWEREWRVPGGLHFERNDVAFFLFPDNSDSIRADFDFEHLIPAFPANGPAGLATAPEQLGDEGDHLIAVFGEYFSEPNELLFYDAENATGYAWPVRCWETEDAVDDIFRDIGAKDRASIVRELDVISTEWVNLAEWREMSE